MKNLNLIRKLAWNFAKKTNVPFDDLFQEASIAYLEALKNFNPEEKVKETTYAWKCIKNHLIDYCKNEYKFQSTFELMDNWPREKHPRIELELALEEKIDNWDDKAKEVVEMVITNPKKYLGSSPKFKHITGTPKERVKEDLRKKGWKHKEIQETVNFLNKAVPTL